MTIKLRSRLLGAHVHVGVFLGTDADHLQNSGDLVMDVGQWCKLTILLASGHLESRRGPDPVDFHFEDADPRLTQFLLDHCDRARQMLAERAAQEEEDQCPSPNPSRPDDASPPKKSTAS
jgi:hypothetical protein